MLSGRKKKDCAAEALAAQAEAMGVTAEESTFSAAADEDDDESNEAEELVAA